MGQDNPTERGRLLAERDSLEEALASIANEALQVEGSQQGREVRVDGASGDGDSLSVERGALRTMATQLEARLSEVAAAIDALEEGTYGICTGCGCEIPAERLEALPGTTECVACKSSSRSR